MKEKLKSILLRINRRGVIAGVLVIALIASGSVFLYRNKHKADTNGTTDEFANYVFIHGQVTLAPGTANPAKGFMVIIDNNNSPTDDSGNYAITIADGKGIGGGTGLADIHFVRLSDNTDWQIADSFEQSTYLSPGLYDDMNFSIEQIQPETTTIPTGAGYQLYTYVIQGTVYSHSKPLAGATVNCGIQANPTLYGTTTSDSNGKYSMTVKAQLGATTGMWVVVNGKSSTTYDPITFSNITPIIHNVYY